MAEREQHACRAGQKPRVFRFAPSPNGYLHRGHAFSALLNQRAANGTGGRFLLRIEDIDRERSRTAFEEAIFEDLGWLGMRWDNPVLKQRDRFTAYADALAELAKLGLVYPAFMTRAEIAADMRNAAAARRPWPVDPDGSPHYSGPERGWSSERRQAEIASGRPYALRLDMRAALQGSPELTWREADPLGAAADASKAADPARWGDVALARKDTPASYHLAVVVDDAHQTVSDVVRGLDLQPATSVHRLLQHLLGLPEPRYFHHRLILDADGRKLSKSRGSETIRARRAAGESPAELIAGLGLPPSGERGKQKFQPEQDGEQPGGG